MPEDTAITTPDEQRLTFTRQVVAELNTQFAADTFDFDAIAAVLSAGPGDTQITESDSVTHQFCGGVYMRTMRVPAGTLIVGKKHAVAMWNILAQGKMSVYCDGQISVHEAPAIIPGQVDQQKLGFAHTECLWINVTPTETTDVDEIERRIYR